MEKIELIDKIFRLLQECLGIEVPSILQNWISLIFVSIILLTSLVATIVSLRKKICKAIPSNWRKDKINEVVLPDYGDQLEERKYFISSKFTTTSPNNLDDPSEVEILESAKKLIDHLLDKVLVEKNSTKRYFCILAGAGMGKTTFAVNLVVDYINRYRKETLPFEIKLVSLARKEFANYLRVENPNKTILILDALDENADASNDISSFMQKLEDLIQDFRFVILTSRTQFFPTEEDEPKKTSILNLGKDKGNYIYHKMYISPFSEEDVQEFLRKKYKQQKKRKRAKKIVDRCSSLATRPLLLSHIDDLLNSNLIYETLSSIYETLIDVWIKREVRFNKGGDDSELHEKLYEFSINFALELFKNREQSTNMRMPKDCYKQFIEKKGYTDYNFSGRSLINRDAYGTMKFSHKTFYEYFLAKAKIQNPDLEIPIKGYELAWEFYREMVREKVSKQSIFALHEDNTALFINSRSIEGFNFEWLDDVYNIQKVVLLADLLVNTSDFTIWLSRSKVTQVDLCNYFNEPLKSLLSMENLKRVNIIKRHAHNPTRINNVIQKLSEKGVDVKIKNFNLPRGVKIYLDKIGIEMYEILESKSPYKHVMIQEIYVSKMNNLKS